jgi:hypothetical protein
MMKIIYPIDDGLAVVTPTGEIPLQEVAKKDVPAGIPYLFIEDSDLPQDRYFREAWEADFSNPDGYGIGHDAWEEANANKD